MALNPPPSTDFERLREAAARAIELGPTAKAMVFVEGSSDAVAIETVAARLGRNLAAERIHVVPIGGASAIGTFLRRFGPQGLGVRVAGLCDAAEVGDFVKGLERSGFGSGLTSHDLARLGFFVCIADLEDELIRALGNEGVEDAIAEQGDLASLRILQQQPAHRDAAPDLVLRRFMGTRSGRKTRYARCLVDAIPLADVPQPLLDLVAEL